MSGPIKLIEIKLSGLPEQIFYRRSDNWGPPVANSWGTRNTERWERGFAAFSKHCCSSRDHVEGKFNLGQWVSIQRYRKDLLSPERKRRLDAISFVWDMRDLLWEQNFAALLKYKQREGHCCVSTYYRKSNSKLGWWVATQRRNKEIMSAERRARLNKIGFVWNLGYGGRWLIVSVLGHTRSE